MNVKAQVEKRPAMPQPVAPQAHATLRWYVLVVVIALGFIAASVIVQKGNWLTGEADQFLVDHLSERSFLSKVLCPHSHDASQYQAREMSHVLEFFDAQFVYWCVKRQMPHFYSIVTYGILLLISVLHLFFCSRYLKLDPWLSVLLVAVFWTTPCIFFSGQYFRNAKQGAALLLFLLVWHLIKVYQAANAAPLTNLKRVSIFVYTFALSLGLCWMDRQGYFLLVALLITLFAFAVGPSFPNRWLLICGIGAGLIAHTAYAKFIGPGLIRNISGFEVSFEYQKLPWDKLLQNWLSYLWQGIVLLINYFRYLFANLTGGLTLFAWGGMWWLFSKVRLPQRNNVGTAPTLEFKSFFGWVFVGWLGLLTIMNALMVLRHEPMGWPDLRLFPHWIPITLVAFLGTTLVLHVFLNRFVLPAWIPRLILAAFVISNVSALSEHYRIFRTGHLQGYVAAAPHLLKAIKDLYNAPPGTVPLKQKFDTAKSARNSGDFSRILKNPLAQPNLTVDEFVFSSSFYNFLRSERNLEFRQP